MTNRAASKQNADLTFRENAQAGRHGWLRLTPAYSYRIVNELLDRVPANARLVLDPFAGTGTTGLASAMRGLESHMIDINPFLHWFASAKTRTYSPADIGEAEAALIEIGESLNCIDHSSDLWQPNLSNIDRWWPQPELRALSKLHRTIREHSLSSSAMDLLWIGFCRTIMSVSNASFGHQSMSFSETRQASIFEDQPQTPAVFDDEVKRVLKDAEHPLPGTTHVHLGDARNLNEALSCSPSILITSPPYANRMSYIRELRPYMYWMRFLNQAREAGELDWQAIGGTWGVATSRMTKWAAEESLPDQAEFDRLLSRIATAEAPNAHLLSQYVRKYIHDMWKHFRSAFEVMAPDSRLFYIVGNSMFYGHLTPIQEWYAMLLRAAGFIDVQVEVIRKRNSNKALFEYVVSAIRP